MRYLILFLFISSLAFGQTRQGYYNASIDSVRVGSDRTTLEKAYTDALIVKKNNPNKLVRVLPPDGWTVVLPVEFGDYVLPLYVKEVYLEKVNDTLNYLNFKISKDNADSVIFNISKTDDIWKTYNITESVNAGETFIIPDKVDKGINYLYFLEVTKGNEYYKTDEYKFNLR